VTKPNELAKRCGDTIALFEEKQEAKESTIRHQLLQGYKTTHSKARKLFF